MNASARKKQKKLIELSVFERIAYSNLDTIRKAQSFLQKNGLPKATDQQDLAMRLAEAVDYLGEGSVPEVLSLHPDAHLFKEEEKSQQEQQLDDCGCAVSDNGIQAPISPVKKQLELPSQQRFSQQSTVQEYTPIILITGFLCVTITALSLSLSNRKS
jgi:hypothetical protein